MVFKGFQIDPDEVVCFGDNDSIWHTSSAVVEVLTVLLDENEESTIFMIWARWECGFGRL